MTNEIIARGALVPVIGALGDPWTSVLHALPQVEVRDDGVQHYGLAEAACLSYGLNVGGRTVRHPVRGMVERPELVGTLFSLQKIPPFLSFFGVFGVHRLSNYARFHGTVYHFWKNLSSAWGLNYAGICDSVSGLGRGSVLRVDFSRHGRGRASRVRGSCRNAAASRRPLCSPGERDF